MRSISLSKRDFSFLSEKEALEAYGYYSAAMSKRRPKLFLLEELFLNHSLNNSDCYTCIDNKGKKGYIFGKYYTGISQLSHFASSSNRIGFELIKNLLDYDNFFFSVTDDLSGMLEKIGYFKANKSIPSFFNEKIVMKNIYTFSLNLKSIVDLSLIDIYKKISSLENSGKCLNELIVSFERGGNEHIFMEKWFGIQGRIRKKTSFLGKKSCYCGDYLFSQDSYFKLLKNKLSGEN